EWRDLDEVRPGAGHYDEFHAAFLRVACDCNRPAAARCPSISLTRASQLSWWIRWLISACGPGVASAASTSRRNCSPSLARRHRPSTATSGRSVDTTGSPAARYSRTLSGLEFRVSWLIRNGLMATSKALL